MIQYMLDTGLMPGTGQDVSMIAAKLGIQGAFQDIQNNHPNDLVSLIMFSRPNYSGEPTCVGQFSQPQVTLTNNYANLINALWYPPNSGTSDVTPWDSNGLQTPRAHGDYDSNTATSYGLMLAYNQFSSSTTLQGRQHRRLGPERGRQAVDFGDGRNGEPGVDREHGQRWCVQLVLQRASARDDFGQRQQRGYGCD